MNLRTAVATGLLVLAVGCGNENDPQRPETRSFDSPREVAAALDCRNFDAEDGAAAPGDVATCDYQQEKITIATGTEQQLDSTVKISREAVAAFGAGNVYVVRGDGWAVLTETSGAAGNVYSKIGGKIDRE